jgi:hypothetical protein
MAQLSTAFRGQSGRDGAPRAAILEGVNMADQTSKQAGKKKDMASWKPGSEADQAKDVAGQGDFGVPAGNGPSGDRDYTSANTRASDPGAAHPMDWEHDGVRDHGAGAADAGPGSNSGGDVDPDLLGFGTGGGVSISGPDQRKGQDDVDGASGSAAFASPTPPRKQGDAIVEPARGRGQTGIGKVGGNKRVAGSTVNPGGDDITTNGSAQGPDAATNPAARGDDSFTAEISSGEAQGQDLGMSPSSDTQGLTQGDNQAYPQKSFPDADAD